MHFSALLSSLFLTNDDDDDEDILHTDYGVCLCLDDDEM